MLSGWERSGWGPRRAWLLVAPDRWLLVHRRWLRKPAVRSLPHRDVVMVRNRDSLLLARLELLTRQNDCITLHLPKTLSRFEALASNRARELSGSSQSAPPIAGTRLAPAAP